MIKQLQNKYFQLFSDKLGKFNKYTINLEVQDNAKPVFFKARSVAFALKDKVGKEIDRLVDLGILKPVQYSTYASPIVPVLKRDGSVRLCADYSVSINKQLLMEQYPLPTINELFSKIHGGILFSKLDLSSAYNQLVLSEDSQNLTCINTHKGLYNFTRLVFGLSSAPSIFQRAIESVLLGIEGVVCLLDDVLIFGGRNQQEHLEILNSVLCKLQNAGLTLHKEKCSFFNSEISYLGYILSKDGLKKSPEKVKAMTEASVPTNVHQLQSFLGLINYYRNFVPNASSILSPLYDLLKKGSRWNWLTEHQSAFDKIKQIMTSEQVLTHYNPMAKLILTVDASPSGLGAILSQIESDGIEKPISFASRTLNSAEKRYAQIQKEATAIIYGVRRFHQYLYGRSVPFILRTDHKPLLSIFGPYKGIPEMSANRLQRYAIFLSSYNYIIEYIRSGDNCADYLSRASLPAPASPEGEGAPLSAHPRPRARRQCACTEQHCHETEIGCDRATYVCFVMDGDNMPVTVNKLRDETNKDIMLRQVITFINNGWPPKCSDVILKPYYLCKSELSVENGCVMRGHKIVLPASLQQPILKELHTSHLGIVKTKAEARSRFWFPGIDKSLEYMIASCSVCTQLRPAPPRAPLAPWVYPAGAFIRIHIDFLGPIRNCTYLVIVDAYSKWVEVYNMNTNTTSAAVKNKLCDFMARFGIPKTLVSDNGTAFCSQELENFCKLNGISHITSPVYHPASNGQAESFVKIVKKGIKSALLSSGNARDTPNILLRYLMDYRNSIHTTTGTSPSQIVFGRKLRSRLDIISLTPSSPSTPAIPNLDKISQCSQSDIDKRKFFKKSDNVFYKKFTNKINYTWCKGIIEKRIGKVMYLIKDIITTECVKRHKNQIMINKGEINNSRYVPELGITPPPPPPPASPAPAPATMSPSHAEEHLPDSVESSQEQPEFSSPSAAVYMPRLHQVRRAELYIPSDTPSPPRTRDTESEGRDEEIEATEVELFDDAESD